MPLPSDDFVRNQYDKCVYLPFNLFSIRNISKIIRKGDSFLKNMVLMFLKNDITNLVINIILMEIASTLAFNYVSLQSKR